jgi:NADP-dependent 3-hydroxy acid dehydrogenase YdfG
MKNKVALVMGGGAGTGRATVLAFAREGAAVVIADINEKSGLETQALVEAQGGQALFVAADMGRAADVQECWSKPDRSLAACTWFPTTLRSARRINRSPNSLRRSGTAAWR